MGLGKVLEQPTNVGLGSLADICTAKSHVRFTPESGHGRARD
jgi:hypothetical protein